jgi:lysozyme family protein
MKGSLFLEALPEAPGPDREAKILEAVAAGLAAPVEWFGVPTRTEHHQGVVYVATDALTLGEPDDTIRVSVTHTTAQRIADALECCLPTTKISDLAFESATVVLSPQLQSPDGAMGFTTRMHRHHKSIELERRGRTGLVRTVGKDWVLTNRLVGQPERAANYGWHAPHAPYELSPGLRGWQPLSLAHNRYHADYSQTVCLVKSTMLVDGGERRLDEVLQSAELWDLVSNEGPLHITRHPGVPINRQAFSFLSPEEPLASRAVRIAEQELATGVHEEPMGSNGGPRIRAYLADCVRDFPLPDGNVEERRLGLTAANWCAAFASYCCKRAALPNEATPHGYRASVAELWKDAVRAGRARPATYAPNIGDLAVYSRSGSDPTLGGIGHVGRVVSAPNGGREYETIEGNHNDRVERVRHVLPDAVGWIVYPGTDDTGETVFNADHLPWLASLADAIHVGAGPNGSDPRPHGLQATPLRAVATAERYEAEYGDLYRNCVVLDARLAEVDGIVHRVQMNQGRYEAVAARLGLPWYLVAVLHSMECGLDFSRHLHNGDPLTARTVHFPAGQPGGEPPFRWEVSAEDALRERGLDKLRAFDIASLLYALEAYNGFGYRHQKPPIRSPYLWSYSNHYTSGKFVGDGHYDATIVSQQCGAAVLLARMVATGAIPPVGV